MASSDEDAPDDETTDEIPDTDEIAELERRALAVEEAHDIERLLDGIARLPPDSKFESLKDMLRELKEAGFAQTMVFSHSPTPWIFCGRRYAGRLRRRYETRPSRKRYVARPGRERHFARPGRA